jgi:hypothetical protein
MISANLHQLIISFERVTGPDYVDPFSGLTITPVVKEFINLVHPDDPRHTPDGKKQANVSFRQLGDMFRNNPMYRNVQYDKVEAV